MPKLNIPGISEKGNGKAHKNSRATGSCSGGGAQELSDPRNARLPKPNVGPDEERVVSQSVSKTPQREWRVGRILKGACRDRINVGPAMERSGRGGLIITAWSHVAAHAALN